MPRRFSGKVDHPSFDEGASIVDSNLNAAAVVPSFDQNPGAKGKGPVGGRHGVHVVPLSTGRPSPVKGVSIPRCITRKPMLSGE